MLTIPCRKPKAASELNAAVTQVVQHLISFAMAIREILAILDTSDDVKTFQTHATPPTARRLQSLHSAMLPHFNDAFRRIRTQIDQVSLSNPWWITTNHAVIWKRS